MKLLAHYGDDDPTPVANGFLFPDGTLFPVDGASIRRPPVSFPIRSDTPGRLDESFVWAGTFAAATAFDPGSGLIAVAGEGSMGADGFVALCEPADRALRWLLFLDFSNPFHAVEFAGGRIQASNNLRERWSIPIDASGAIEVISLGGF